MKKGTCTKRHNKRSKQEGYQAITVLGEGVGVFNKGMLLTGLTLRKRLEDERCTVQWFINSSLW